MEKYRLTVEEWFVIQLLFLASADERQSEPLIKYYSTEGLNQTPLRVMLTNLQEKGILTKEYKIPAPGKKFDPEGVIFNKNFLKDKLKYSLELWEDLYNAYPNEINNLKMRNYAKFYDSEEKAAAAYGKAIGWNPKKHEEVMEILEWAKENNRLAYGICEFIISKKWRELEEERRDGYNGEMCIMEAI